MGDIFMEENTPEDILFEEAKINTSRENNDNKKQSNNTDSSYHSVFYSFFQYPPFSMVSDFSKLPCIFERSKPKSISFLELNLSYCSHHQAKATNSKIKTEEFNVYKILFPNGEHPIGNMTDLERIVKEGELVANKGLAICRAHATNTRTIRNLKKDFPETLFIMD